jgi:hypothetical protein
MKRVLAILGVALCVLTLMGFAVAGKTYQKTMIVETKPLHLLGAGIREKWMFEVYVMGVYSESGKCNAKDLIGIDEVKYLRIDMLRDVSAEKMAETLGEAFKEHMPKDASAELKKQQQELMTLFKDECKKDTVIEIIYTPESGTIMKQNGKQIGKFAGKAFQTVLWDIYFGENTCCSGLKESVFKSCTK